MQLHFPKRFAPSPLTRGCARQTVQRGLGSAAERKPTPLRNFEEMTVKLFWPETTRPDVAFLINYALPRLNDGGVRYWLNDGSLLGCYRDHDVILGDDDADVLIVKDDFDRACALLETDPPLGVTLQRRVSPENGDLRRKTARLLFNARFGSWVPVIVMGACSTRTLGKRSILRVTRSFRCSGCLSCRRKRRHRPTPPPCCGLCTATVT